MITASVAILPQAGFFHLFALIIAVYLSIGMAKMFMTIMLVDVMCPKEFVGDVIGYLNSRKGVVLNIESKPGMDHIHTQVPLAQMFGYSTALRSSTQGRGTYTMEFSHFAVKEGGFN